MAMTDMLMAELISHMESQHGICEADVDVGERVECWTVELFAFRENSSTFHHHQ